MKKIIAILTVLSLILIAGLAAMAENDAAPVTCPASCLISCPMASSTSSPVSAPSACPAGCAKARFVDADGDGVCDGFADADGDGVCDGCGLRQGGRGQRQGACARQGNRSGANSTGRGMNRRGR